MDARGEGGQTALLAATEEGLGSCVERLIDHGADVNKANFEGNASAAHFNTLLFSVRCQQQR